jgi:hypothetical protein
MESEVQRRETSQIREIRGWMLVYGRRKVGKTYLLKHFVKWDAYFLVRRDGTVLCEGIPQKRVDDIRVFSSIIEALIGENKTIIIDEYQRLPPEFFDEVALAHPNGKLILSGSVVSTLHKFFGTSSPMLGLLAEYKLGLISPSDALSATKTLREHSVDYAAFIRDPWVIPKFSYGEIMDDLYAIAVRFRGAVPRLVGEAFQEENRMLTKTYEAIIREIGAGYWNAGDIAHSLSNKRVIERDDSRLIHPFLANLVSMDLVEETYIHPGKKKKYQLKSPVFWLFYYLVDKHKIESSDEVSPREVEENIRRSRNFIVQNFIADLFAESLDGRKECSFSPEIDIIITQGRNRSPILVGEVKWGKWKASEARAFLDKVSNFSCRKVFVVRDKKDVKIEGVDILDWKDLQKLASSLENSRAKK